MKNNNLPKLNIIKVVRFTGDRKSAVLSDGKAVYRQEKLWMGKDYKFVHCADFGSHFIYHDPDFNSKTGNWPTNNDGSTPKKYLGRWTPICTCGSPAAVIGSDDYKKWASPTNNIESTTPGQLLMCISLLNYGHHMDNSTD
jgi:hypothetical protein